MEEQPEASSSNSKKRLPKRNAIQETRKKKKKKSAKEKEEEEMQAIQQQQQQQQQFLQEQLELEGNFSRLTPDIFIDIMSRVPIKSLSLCRWVSKSWFNFIHTSCFALLHYSKSIETNTSPCVLLYKKNTTEFHLIDHGVFDKNQVWAPLHYVEFTEFQETFQDVMFEIVGSVNGLVCFTPHSMSYSPLPYYICNPITREHVILPKSPRSKRCPALCGFGYDSVSNEYKAIRFLQTLKSLKAEAEVFTLGSKSWRPIADVPYITKRVSSNVLVNSRLHWLTSEIGGSLIIIAFDIGSEEFCRIQPPPVSEHKQKEEVSYLGELARVLCCFEFNVASYIGVAAIWVMKEYGVQESWVKQYMFRKEVMPRPWDGCYKATKLRNGEFLLQYEGKNLGYYDPTSETYRGIVIQNNQRLQVRSMRAEIFVGSLISPKTVGRSMIR